MEAEEFNRRYVESITFDVDNPAIVLRMKDGTEVRYEQEETRSSEEEV